MSSQQIHNAFRPEVLARLLLVLALVIAPQYPQIPLWLLAVSAAFGVWCYSVSRQRLKQPGKWLRTLLSVLLLLAVYSHYGTLLGRDAGASLLIAMMALKLMEIKAARDIYIVVFLGYFLIIIGFLFTQSPWMAGYMLGAVILLTAVLIDLNRVRTTALAVNLRLGVAMLARALPLAMVLFLLFPRIGGPLWGMPKDAYGHMSGLSDDMTPGQISQLSLSDAVAFRATFDGAAPPPLQRYWRGPVLWDTDGNGWSAGRLQEGLAENTPPPYTRSGSAVSYTVTLEAHNRRWLYALDLIAAVPPGTKITPDYLMLSAAPIRERRRYTVSSYLDGVVTRLSTEERRRALQLPASGNARARALARSWREGNAGAADIVGQALQRFRSEPFVYTLHPPLIENDFVDTFLFDTRKGFCEHYAASFTFLMRAAGIPARVVTGYQGGTLNPIGNYLIVRQRDAHAWAEVWLEGQGWMRVDPTAAVAPERVELGIDNTLQQIGAAVRFDMPRAAWLHNFWRDTLFGLDALNNKWNQWVLGYGPDRQEELLGRLGLGGLTWRSAAVILLVAIGALLVWALIRLQGWERRPRDLAALAYQVFCHKLARMGLQRSPFEGPGGYLARIAAGRPELARQARTIIQLYIALRYAPHHSPLALAQLRRAVRRFNP